jgi:nicotinamidase-related amidase
VKRLAKRFGCPVELSAFEGTPLSYALKDCGILGVAIVGIALEIGIEPTVRHATDLGFIPIVLADACGIGNTEAGARSLDTMRFVGEALISDVDSFSRATESGMAAEVRPSPCHPVR